MSGPQSRHRWRGIWWIVPWALLAVGLAASGWGGAAWTAGQRRAAVAQFNHRASAAAAVIDASLQRDLDFERSFSQFIATSAPATNASLDRWLSSLDIARRYPGTVGLSMFEPVAADRLGAYETAVTADPVGGFEKGPYAVYPPGQRASYCLMRFGMVLSPTGEPPGVDACAGANPTKPSRIAIVMARATATGQPVYFGFSSLLAAFHGTIPVPLARIFRSQYEVFLAVYSNGKTPVSVAARQASVVGWAVADFDGAALVRAAVSGAQSLSLALLASDGSQLASVGPKPGHGEFSSRIPLPVGVVVLTSGPVSGAPLTQGTVLALLGSTLAVLLFLFTFQLGRSRGRAMRLVDERTADLRFQAEHDALTGLPNRALLFDCAQQMLARAHRHGRSVGALYVDLDNFKDVNDSFGHKAGDELLKSVAKRLAAAVRRDGTVGRLGGDEFLILTDQEEGTGDAAEMIAERVIALFDHPFALSIPEPIVLAARCSIGVAVGRTVSAEELVRNADVALYSAKESGKSRHVRFRPEMQTAVQDRVALEIDLQTAVDNDELFLLYQPIFDIAGLTTKAVEALVRWRHPTRGVVMPDQLIPIAEQSGLIGRVGQYVLEEACRQAGLWKRAGHQVVMSVNVSMAQFESEGFVDAVRREVERNELDPRMLTLEVTESLLMRDPAATAAVLASLREIGVSVAIDDFGTGYSSLAYLRQLPISALKIDRSFIAKATVSQRSAVLVRTLIQLAKDLGIETIAEGIEEPSQLALLQQEHCDSGQGFLYSRPLTADDVAAQFLRVEPDKRSCPERVPTRVGTEDRRRDVRTITCYPRS